MPNFCEKDDIVFVKITIEGINCKLKEENYSTPDDHHSGGCLQGIDEHEAVSILHEVMKMATEEFKNKGYKIYSIAPDRFSAQKM